MFCLFRTWEFAEFLLGDLKAKSRTTIVWISSVTCEMLTSDITSLSIKIHPSQVDSLLDGIDFSCSISRAKFEARWFTPIPKGLSSDVTIGDVLNPDVLPCNREQLSNWYILTTFEFILLKLSDGG